MNTLPINKDTWTKTQDHIFWGEIAPCDHVVQIYENDESFLDLLSGFVSGGFQAGDGVIVIATDEHLRALNQRLNNLEYDVADLISNGHYAPLDAEKTLAKFMVNDWPDENLFRDVIRELIYKARKNGQRVRAFGEMVAILWAKGKIGATVRLEQLWNDFCEQEAFCLFCAYPQSGFTQDATDSLMHICKAHSKIISGSSQQGKAEIFYKDVQQSNVG